MDDRETVVLKQIIHFQVNKSFELERKLNLTPRQLSYSLKKINIELDRNNLASITRSNAGQFFIPNESKSFLEKQIQSIPDTNRYFNENQRMYLTILYLLTSGEIVSLVHIYEFLNVSKTTATSDLKNVKKYLKKYSLKLIYSRKDGYRITGSELKVKQIINELVATILHFEDGMELIVEISNISVGSIIHYTHKIEQYLNITYSDQSFNQLVYSLMILIARNRSCQVSKEPYFKADIRDTSEYDFISNVIPEKWIANKDDYKWILLLFISANTVEGQIQYQNSDLLEIVHEMVQQFESLTYVEIKNKPDFEKRLVAHIQPMILRIRYGLHLKDSGIKSAVKNVKNHQMFVDTVSQIVKPLEKELKSSLPKDEIELISFYFGSELENWKPEEKKRAAVVCSNGVIVSRLMFKKLREMFPEISFVSASSVREFQKFKNDFDIVFTTVHLETDSRQYIIHPIMTTDESLNLRYRVLRDIGFGNSEEMLDGIMNIISRHGQIDDEIQLRKEIQLFLLRGQDDGVKEKEYLPDLLSYIKPEFISFTDQTLSWTEALELATRPLMKKGIVTDKFLKQIIKESSSMSNYSYFGKNMAIPHTTPDMGVSGNGFGFLISKKSIKFPNNDDVHIIVPLAVGDTTSHFKAVEQLANIAANSKAMKSLINADSKNKVINEIKRRIKE
ncbi:BglG family transcription antiterminator [Companilactobacillus sp. HBUAS56275]|uniref:Ascorbate-specific PTS system EIIA component n=1 Tax=Candidatus Companilactobacillus pullicola TaxID=2838523 RepID=A0A9D1ZR79_9LACO|nr:BglG family transcription antiterminator [Candidatus Companilactobacillus pullicola]